MSDRNSLYYIFSVVRIFLYPFALIYGAVVWLRNRLYDTGFFSSVSFSIPVISVGNLSVGGTGKTPHVEYLIRLLQYQYKVATMSRGYKRRTQGFLLADENANALRIGDEPMQYHMKYPDVAVSVAEERITGIPRLLQQQPGTEVVLLDDAYQHRSVKPGINILITDYAKPFYKDAILPYGTLRERRKAYHRADLIVMSKCPPNMNKTEADAIIQSVNPLSHQEVFFSTLRYDIPYTLFSKEQVHLKDKNVLVVCGIAKPEQLVAYVSEQSQSVHALTYADHHYFVSKDLEEIKSAFDNWDKPGKIILTTEKDAARLQLHQDKLQEWKVTIAVLPVQIEFLFNAGNQFDSLITQYVEKEVTEHHAIEAGNF
jgi:tetraacyldisaccharide 4'-kinase